MKNNEQNMTYAGKMGFWLVVVSVFLGAYLWGWNTGVSSVCSDSPNSPHCIEKDF